MLAVAECCPEREDESSMLLKAFTKKRGGLTPTPEKTPERRPTTLEIKGKDLSTNGQQKSEENKIKIVKEKGDNLKEQQQTVTTTRRKVKKERDGDLAKKRSKSEARRTVDQQRTRSSTEHTSTKKQRQDNENEEGNVKVK